MSNNNGAPGIGTIPFTFESTGVTVFVKPVPPMLMNDARRAIKRPVPPQQTIENADGSTRLESNPSHPDYITALNEYDQRVAMFAQRMMVRRGVVLDLTDEQRAELTALRQEMAEDGIELDSDDKVAYVLYVAAGSANDVTELVRAITERGQPTDPKSRSG